MAGVGEAAPKRISAAAGDEAFITTAVDWLVERIGEAVAARGKCVFGLSGGSTPGPIYQRLGESDKVDWKNVMIFLVDERHVPADNSDSNANLQQRTLLAGNKIPEANVIFPDCTKPIQETVTDYGQRLEQLFAEHGGPDLLTLGLGPDGHIASLFPPVQQADKDATCIHTTTERFAVFDRITITLPIIARATNSVFFFKGEEKLAVWDDMMRSFADQQDPSRWPAHGLDFARVTVISQP
jgi:6-phosphogluconolactonase